jgi:hypothetical protein
VEDSILSIIYAEKEVRKTMRLPDFSINEARKLVLWKSRSGRPEQAKI